MPIHVVAAIIKHHNKTLIARRSEDKSLAGYWEFPGGKVDEGESNEAALVREIREELDLVVQVDGYRLTSIHDYEFGIIHLHGYDCHIEGEIPEKIHSTDHDQVLWVERSHLVDYIFAPADVPIIEHLIGNEGRPLMGGNMNTPILKDHEVYKDVSCATPSIHKLLKHLGSKGIQWVPKSRVDLNEGKHILSYIEGVVPHDMPQWIWSEAILLDIGMKMREWHDATLDFEGGGLQWNYDSGEPYEVICHNDFAPYNCVFNDKVCVGLIDFDVCSPGTRLWDLAYMAYRYVPLCPTDNIDRYKECSPFTKEAMLVRLKALIRAYGGDTMALNYDVNEVIEKVQERLRALAIWSEAYARETHRDDILGHARMYELHAGWLECLLDI